jgi:hypothetical protein
MYESMNEQHFFLRTGDMIIIPNLPERVGKYQKLGLEIQAVTLYITRSKSTTKIN